MAIAEEPEEPETNLEFTDHRSNLPVNQDEEEHSSVTTSGVKFTVEESSSPTKKQRISTRTTLNITSSTQANEGRSNTFFYILNSLP